MKNLFNKFNGRVFKIIIFPLLFLTLTFCITISKIDQPSNATIGEKIKINLQVDVKPSESNEYNVILGVLVPENWEIETNTLATYTSDNGSGTFSLTPDATLALQMTDLVGIGKNYGRVKWVAFVSDGKIKGTNNVNFSGQIHLEMTVGNENVKTQLGYIVATSGWGISDKNIDVKFTDCMEVSGGTNSLSDLCGPIPFPVTFKPSQFTLDDVIKITFDANKGPTDLLGAEKVYICGTVIADGIQKDVCVANSSNILNNIGPNIWEISIWGKQFFNLPMGANITFMSFNFRNEVGDIIVKNRDTFEDFQITPSCKF